MDEQAFALLLSRFDTIEEQNRLQLELMQEHIKIDNKVHRVVERHSAYFRMIGLGVPAVTGWIAYKLGIK
ncbi:MAG: hypothetical protein ACRD32_06745 [Nitrososphaerales archaeon]